MIIDIVPANEINGTRTQPHKPRAAIAVPIPPSTVDMVPPKIRNLRLDFIVKSIL